MKFLTIATMKDSIAALPPAVGRQLTEASLAYMNQLKREGKILEFYFVPSWGRSIVIGEAKSAEELAQNIIGVPLKSFMGFETYPLADFNESIKMEIEAIKAMEKLCATPPK
jgi:muconolactone delta-isomerase